jgi:2,5-furandicarboxylate decarboxylase 1
MDQAKLTDRNLQPMFPIFTSSSTGTSPDYAQARTQPTFDLRNFVNAVKRERPSDVLEIGREIDPQYETTALITKLEQHHRSPLVFFHRVRGTTLPLVSNVCGSAGRLALALGCNVRELASCYASRIARPIKPEIIASAPSQEQITLGAEIDLYRFPQLRYHNNDADCPYFTAAIVVARDPETGKSNLSFHRLMVTSRATTTIFMARGKHLERIYQKYEAMCKPMPIAAFIGTHPTCALGSLYTGSAEVEEYEVIGALQQSPLQLTRCITQPLEVPAHCEIVLEGTVEPRIRVHEGPFGEFTGFSTGTMSTPAFHVEAVTSRCAPWFQDIVSGHSEHKLLPVLGSEHYLTQVASSVVLDTVRVRMIAPLTVVAAIRKAKQDDPANLIHALLRADIYVKQVIVVDHDVDPGDTRQVMTAVALQVRPDRDIYIVTDTVGTELDPSIEQRDSAGAKLGIDATMPLTMRNVKRNAVPSEVMNRIDLNEVLGRS